MAFPTSPTDGQIFDKYEYNSGIWSKVKPFINTWDYRTDASAVRSYTIYNNSKNALSAIASAKGQVCRFTAPLSGTYQYNMVLGGIAPASDTLICLYASYDNTKNNIQLPGNGDIEILDLRIPNDNINDGHSWSFAFYLDTGDYIETDFYRNANIYIDAGVTVRNSMCYLG